MKEYIAEFDLNSEQLKALKPLFYKVDMHFKRGKKGLILGEFSEDGNVKAVFIEHKYKNKD